MTYHRNFEDRGSHDEGDVGLQEVVYRQRKRIEVKE